MMDNFIQQNLLGKLWHTTLPERFNEILRTGFIKSEPDIPDNQRYGTGCGPDYYPYVRHLGGISLFQFPSRFNLDVYLEEIPTASLEQFIPFNRSIGEAIWLEIDSDTLSEDFISGQEVRGRWRKEEAYAHKFIAELEAAYVGDLPISSISKAYYVSSTKGWRKIPMSPYPLT